MARFRRNKSRKFCQICRHCRPGRRYECTVCGAKYGINCFLEARCGYHWYVCRECMDVGCEGRGPLLDVWLEPFDDQVRAMVKSFLDPMA